MRNIHTTTWGTGTHFQSVCELSIYICIYMYIYMLKCIHKIFESTCCPYIKNNEQTRSYICTRHDRSRIAKTLGSTSIKYRSDTFASDWYMIDIDPRVFAIWVRGRIDRIRAVIETSIFTATPLHAIQQARITYKEYDAQERENNKIQTNINHYHAHPCEIDWFSLDVVKCWNCTFNN